MSHQTEGASVSANILPLATNAVVPLRITVESICTNAASLDALHEHLARGIHPDDDISGGTPLLIAASHGHAGCLEALLCAGADPNFAGRTEVNLTNRGAAAALDRWMNGTITPLYITAQQGHASCVSILILAGANPNDARSNDGTTPLYATCSNGHADCAARLLSAGADPNKPALDGSTPLGICCRQGHVECARLLCGHDANVDARDGAGHTPLQHAFDYMQLQPWERRVQVRASRPT